MFCVTVDLMIFGHNAVLHELNLANEVGHGGLPKCHYSSNAPEVQILRHFSMPISLANLLCFVSLDRRLEASSHQQPTRPRRKNKKNKDS